MKTETHFDILCKDVYKTIGLEYKLLTEGDEEEIEEVDCDIRRFIKKTKSYNINKDKLRTHYASKKLSKFIEDSERKRRDAEEKEGLSHDAVQQNRKYQVLDFIDQLTAKARVEKVHRDSVVGIKTRCAKVDALQELTHVTGVMTADKLSYQEQQRRVDELQSKSAQSKAVHMMNQLGPVHSQLSDAFNRTNGDSKLALQQVKSVDTFSDHGSSEGERKSSIELNCQMKSIIAHVKYNPAENPANEIMPTDVLHGVGHIGRVTHKNDKQFTENIKAVRRNSDAKYTMQNELLYKVETNNVEKTLAVEKKGMGHERKMTVVLDTLVHKANGKEIEKQIAQAGKAEAMKEARRGTLEGVKDFGRRLSVAQDAKDTSYTTMKHDAKAEQGHAVIVAELSKNDTVQPALSTKHSKKALASASKTKMTVAGPGMKQVAALRRASITAQAAKPTAKSATQANKPASKSPKPAAAEFAVHVAKTSPAAKRWK